MAFGVHYLTVIFTCFCCVLKVKGLSVGIGILLDESTDKHSWNYDSYISTWGIPGADITLEKVNINHKDPFQLYTKVCQMVSNGSIAFITNAQCDVLQSLSSLVNKLQVPIISIEEKCDYLAKNDNFLLSFPPEKPDMTEALRGVLKTLAWMDALVIYGEEQADEQADTVNSALANMNITVQSFLVRKGTTDADVRVFLDYLHHHEDIKRQVIVLCDIDCLASIMTQADQYDKRADQQARFTFDTKWLLVGDRNILDLLPSKLKNIVNVAAIVPSQDAFNATSSFVMGAMAKIRWSLSVATDVSLGGSTITSSTHPTICGSVLSIIRGFLAELQMQLSTSSCINCSLYEMHSAMFISISHSSLDLQDNKQITPTYFEPANAKRNRQFELVGEWRELNGIVMFTSLYPNIDYKMNQIHFVFGTNLWDPFVLLYDNHTSGFGGLCIEIIDELARNMNFTYSFILPSDGSWGNFVNGSWTGLVGQLENKEVDMTIAPLAITAGRETVMDFSTPYYLEYSTVLVKYTNPGDSKWRLYINPFRWQVWLCIAGAIPLAGVIMYLMTRYSPFYSPKEARKGLGCLDNAIFYAFGSFFTQGGIHLPDAQSGRFFVGFWWMYCTVVIATYSGNLIAFLTVSKATVPFQTLDEMVQQTTHKFGTLDDTAMVYHLQLSNTGVAKAIWERMEQFVKEDPDVLGSSHSSHIQKVLQSEYAYIGDKTSFELEMSKDSGCDIDMIKDEFIPYQYAVGLQNNSAYKRVFDEEITNMLEGGVINKWKQKWWPRQSFCSRGIVTESKAVSISDVQGAYYLMAIFLFLSFTALFSEMLARYKKVKVLLKNPVEESDEKQLQTRLEYDQFGRLIVPGLNFSYIKS